MFINGSTIISQGRITKLSTLNGWAFSLQACMKRRLDIQILTPTPSLHFRRMQVSHLPIFVVMSLCHATQRIFFVHRKTFIIARKLAQRKSIALSLQY